MAFDRKKPYNDLPLLPPKIDIETHAVLKKAISANKAIAELRASGHMIPNQGVLIRTLGLSEAKFSSEIENIVTTNDNLYLASADGGQDFDSPTKEVLYYKDALWFGFDRIKKEKKLINARLFEEIVQILKNVSLSIRKVPGTALINANKEVIYTPPDGEEIIRQKLTDLEKFIYNETSLDPLIQMAIVHYQFEAIHPFADGNGRTGRILNILFLIEKGLLDIPVLYLSRYILSKKSLYYNGLIDVTENNAWENWILFILEGLEQTAILTRKKILAIYELMHATGELVKTKTPRIYSKDLIEVLFFHPYCKIRFLEDAGIAKRQTASQYLKQLEQIGLLRSLKIGRETYYIHDAFLKLLAD
ncbi:MAG: Fic family protein [Candidatus Melainabacteria bacterium]|nr:Fic family protein [Candidatus Melainabacteria bacterium]